MNFVSNNFLTLDAIRVVNKYCIILQEIQIYFTYNTSMPDVILIFYIYSRILFLIYNLQLHFMTKIQNCSRRMKFNMSTKMSFDEFLELPHIFFCLKINPDLFLIFTHTGKCTLHSKYICIISTD